MRLENPAQPVKYQGVVSTIKDSYGFIERADVVDEIFFHFSEAKNIPGGLKLGDDVEFFIQTRNVSEPLFGFLICLYVSSYNVYYIGIAETDYHFNNGWFAFLLLLLCVSVMDIYLLNSIVSITIFTFREKKWPPTWLSLTQVQ